MPSKQIYFDYNATAPVLPELITRYKNYLSIYGNPSSFHALGRQARTAIDEARETIASHIGAHRSQVLFCASGSEANTQVIHTVVMKQILEHKPQHIIYSAIEHPCILNAVKWAEKMGVPVTEIGTNTLGQINLRDIEAAIRPDTTLITIMWANNEIGTIQPVQEVAEIAKNHGIHFHCDGVQALGKLAIDLNRIRIDSLTL
ncbi:aminotransferase class V-fold PLP-dependent enzyme, partial [bacterium]|nr:aminotransferase class V-fold PLP-dependent enzyme [bacterium]